MSDIHSEGTMRKKHHARLEGLCGHTGPIRPSVHRDGT
ncbi:hypothetical protein MAR_014629 [Mya arenaria]|uniref:Uncharacterized protein n=1 Tax=Mya arenaria TaxID=6604 RepID=A0ABY7G3B4_MYAAR|nr:hypothetical protein MAR_014629 [Mya arenaria]